MSIVVFDIDGVVADVRHRLHYLHGRRRWSAFFNAAADDTLLAEGARLVADLGAEHDVVWLTGRPEWLRDVTGTWLEQYDLPADELFMRPNHDYRPAAAYKLDVLERLRTRPIAGFVDDDDEVVQAALAADVPAVLAQWVSREDSLREAQDLLGRT